MTSRELIILISLITAIAYCRHLDQQVVQSSAQTAKAQSTVEELKKSAEVAATELKKCGDEKGWLEHNNERLTARPATTEAQALASVGKTASVLGLDLGPVTCAVSVGSYNDEAMCWVIIRHGGNGGRMERERWMCHAQGCWGLSQ